ncbi:glycosyltransferase family 4 protein [Nodosilinea nodulosa]|uniref:glycosyltransferase family 4 protein n=1 Tax=Nodosilinea nodulosa TaxID=416001 RepID=UPI0004749FD7|nr:glycosyltransferase family 1 protein [Nodosilinea nodulosa]
MRIAILRRSPGVSASMDVYADAVVAGLRTVRPDWDFVEIAPDHSALKQVQQSWQGGLHKYYQRYWSYPRSLRHLKADVAHIIDHSDGYLVPQLQRLGLPTVVTCHDIINWIRPDWFQGRARLPWVSMATWKYAVRGMARAEHIFTVSHYTAKDLTRHLGIPPQQITVTPNGVNPSMAVRPLAERASVRQRYGLSEPTCCLLNVGSNNPRKNLEGILNALVQLRGQMPVHLWKVGSDFTLAQWQFIDDQGLQENVSYLGQPDLATLNQIYSAADILMAPSFYEGFGLTVLEAMACGTAVVVSNVTALPEVAGDAALLVDPLDEGAIAQAVRQLWGDPELRHSLVARGRERINLFTWEKTAQKIADAYQDVLKKG